MKKKLVMQDWALREDKTNKLRYDLIPLDQLKRLAEHYTKWGLDHWDRNWESWGKQYMEDCRKSAFRHFIQRMNNEENEDHDIACIRNIFAYEHLQSKLKKWNAKSVKKNSDV